MIICGYFGVHFCDFSPISPFRFPRFSSSFFLFFGLHSSGFDGREFNLCCFFFCTSFRHTYLSLLYVFRCHFCGFSPIGAWH